MLFYESQSYKEYSAKTFHSTDLHYQDNLIVDGILKRGYNLVKLGEVENFSKHSKKDSSVLTDEEIERYRNHYWKFVEIEAFKKVYHLATDDIRLIVDKWTPTYLEVLKMEKLISIMDKAFKNEEIDYDETHHLFGYDIAMASFIVSKSNNFTLDDYTFYRANKLPIKQLNDDDVAKHLSMLLRGVNNGYSSLLLYYTVFQYFFTLTSAITKTLFTLDKNISMKKDTTYVKAMWKKNRYYIGKVMMYGDFDDTKIDFVSVYGKQYKIYKPNSPKFMLRINNLYYEVNLEINMVRLLDFDNKQRSYTREELYALRRFQDFLWGDIVKMIQLFATNLSDYFDLLSNANIPTEYAGMYQDTNVFKTTITQMAKISGMMVQGEINSKSEALSDETDFVASQFEDMQSITEQVNLLFVTMKSNCKVRKSLVESVTDISEVDELLKTVAENESILHSTAKSLQESLGKKQNDNARLEQYAKDLKSFKPSRSGNVHQAVAENKTMLKKAQALKKSMESSKGLADMQVTSAKFNSSSQMSKTSSSPLTVIGNALSGLGMKGFSIPDIPKIPDVKALMDISIPQVATIPVKDDCTFDLQDSSGLGMILAGMTAFIDSLQAIAGMVASIIQGIIDVFSAILCALIDVIKTLLKAINCLLSVVLAGVELVGKTVTAITSFIAKLGDSVGDGEFIDEVINGVKYLVKNGVKFKIPTISLADAFESVIAFVADTIMNFMSSVSALLAKIEAWTPLDEIEEIFNNLLAGLSVEKLIEGISNLLRGSLPSSIESAVDAIIDMIMKKLYLASATLNSMKLQKLYNSLVASKIAPDELARIMEAMAKMLEECNKPKPFTDEERADIKAKLLSKLRDKANPMDKAKDCLGVDFASPSFDFNFSLPSFTLPRFNMSC